MVSYTIQATYAGDESHVTRPATPVAVIIFLTFLFGGLIGCSTKTTPSDDLIEREAVVPDPLTLLVIGDTELGKRIARQWSARRDGELTIVDIEAEQFVSSGFEIGDPIDIVIYPPGMLGDLTALDRLMPLPSDVWNSDGIKKVELLRHFRVSIARRANETWAVPLGGPNFGMLCNQAVFAAIKSDPPETWEELDRDLIKIQSWLATDQPAVDRKQNLAAKVDMPLAKGWAAHTFLARVAPAICHRGKLSTVFNRRTVEPLIASPPFVEALEHLKLIASQRSLDLRPADVFELAISGQSTIALGWPALGFSNAAENDVENARDPDDPDDPDETTSDPITINSLPGSQTWFDHQNETWNKRSDTDKIRVDLIGFSGLVASVSADTRNGQTALDFIQWLPSKSISLLTLVDSPSVGPFRASHLGDASRWTGDAVSIEVADQYADIIAENHKRSLVLLFPRIPGHSAYVATLDDAVREFMSGSQSAQKVLNALAQKWETITDAIGREKQIKQFKKESGF